MFGRFRDRLGDVRGSFSDRFGAIFEKSEIQNSIFIYYPLWGLGWASYSAKAQNPKVEASPELKIHQKSIKSMRNKNGHETVRKTSSRPLATTVLHEISPRFSWHRRFCKLRTSKFRTFPGPSRELCVNEQWLMAWSHIFSYIFLYFSTTTATLVAW